MALLYPILQGGTEELLFPPPYQPPEPPPAPVIPSLRDETQGGGPAQNTRHRRVMPQEGPADSTVALCLRVAGPPDEEGNQPHQYRPFSTSDLYNWRSQNAKFSDNPRDLTNLLETVLFTHQRTWDDCQQLLQILFTTEERERIQNEARRRVPGANGEPTTKQMELTPLFLYRNLTGITIWHEVRRGSGSTARLFWQGLRQLHGNLLT